MAKTKIAVLWGLLIAMMVACAGIYAALKAREINPYIGSTGTYVETVSLHPARFFAQYPGITFLSRRNMVLWI